LAFFSKKKKKKKEEVMAAIRGLEGEKRKEK